MSDSRTGIADSIAEIQRALDVFCAGHDVVELRAPKVPNGKYKAKTHAGFFDRKHRPEMAKAAAALSWSAQAPGVYFTINPVLPDMLAKAANRTRDDFGEGDGTADKYIVRRVWILVDIDPVRDPPGISANEAEHEAAMALGLQIRDDLLEDDFPEPVVIDSGNGCHLYFRVDLPNNEASKTLIHRFLLSLADKYDTDKVKIDTTVANAARISKLPGTWARKGDGIEGRPHRLAKFLEVPDKIEVARRELIEEWAALAPEANGPSTKDSAPTEGRTDFKIDLLSQEVRAHQYERYMKSTPALVSGDHRQHRAFCHARLIWADFAIDESLGFPLLERINANAMPPLTPARLRQKWDAAIKRGGMRGSKLHPVKGMNLAAAQQHGVNGFGSNQPTASTSSSTDLSPDSSLTMKLVVRTLRDVKVLPVNWLIPNVLLAGKVNLLAGPGGEGKSTLVRRIIADGTKGVPTMGMQYDAPAPFDSLVYSLEEDIADAIKPALLAAGADLVRIHVLDGVADDAKPGAVEAFTVGHVHVLAAYLKANAKIRLVVLDPITGVLGKVNQDKAAEVRAAMQPLVELAKDTGVSIVCITHTGKAQDVGRAVDKILGSVQFVNVARHVLMLMRDENDADLKLLVSGAKTNYGGRGVHAFRLANLNDDELHGIRESDELDHLNYEDQAKFLAGLRTIRWDAVPEDFTPEKISKPKRTAATNKAACIDFIKDFVADFAFPHAEVEAAALKAGFSVSAFNAAKADLKAEQLVWPKCVGFGPDGVWWLGTGRNTSLWTYRPEALSMANGSGMGTVESVESVESTDSDHSP